jgi:tetratricopeptide (TPR) repeat protein
MMREYCSALLLLYIRPGTAVSRILDHGRLWLAILAALGVSMLFRFAAVGSIVRLGWLEQALWSWAGYSTLAPLMALVLVFVPAVIFLRAASGFGGFGVLMGSDYSSLLMCVMSAWAAAYLAAGALGLFLPFGLILVVAANLYFVVLAAFCIRAVFGTGFAAALGLAVVGSVAAVGGIALSDLAGGLKYYLMSPFLLYYAYSMFGSDVRSLGEGLRGRQQFQRQLEIATTNPRDSDAHYQLGLVYQKRRQYTEAIARFEKAIAIDPTEVDAQFQLGRIAREQGRFEDAIRYLKAAAALDDKLSSSEVWRELGAAYVGESKFVEAEAALKKYTDRRSYDPEGLYWYGKALVGLGRADQAQAAFAQCVEAVDTMPKHRRALVRKWKGMAKKELA